MSILHFFCVFGIVVISFNVRNVNSDELLSMKQLITNHGYPFQSFTDVYTEDGYVLNIFRIPHGKVNRTNNSNKPVILFMHGLLGSSSQFVVTGPKKALPFLMAEKGYDVWLGNARGNSYSRKHVTLHPDKDKQFWEFSWHEIGKYDLPAMINYIKSVTKQNQLTYVGISQGTTVFFVMGSERPEFNKRIKLMVALAPVTYNGNTQSPLVKLLSPMEPVLTSLFKTLGLYEFPIKFVAQMINIMGSKLCTIPGFVQELCLKAINVLGGFNPSQVDRYILPALYATNPSGGSTKQVLHFAQIINSKNFQQYDFGKKENLKVYKSEHPPYYNLTRVTAPVALYYSDGDWLSDTKDVERLKNELGNLIYSYKVPQKKFTHFDFILAKDVIDLLYKNVINLIQEYNKN